MKGMPEVSLRMSLVIPVLVTLWRNAYWLSAIRRVGLSRCSGLPTHELVELLIHVQKSLEHYFQVPLGRCLPLYGCETWALTSDVKG